MTVGLKKGSKVAGNMVTVDYRCLQCGHLEAIQPNVEGVSLACRSCGFRIFVKPRRTGFKNITTE